MKSICVILLIITAGLLFKLSAQEVTGPPKGGFEFSIGMNAFGPVKSMEDHMIEHDFDLTTSAWFFGGGTITHPNISGPALSFSAGYFHRLKKQNSLGFRITYDFLREISGVAQVDNSNAYIFLEFRNLSFIPYYRHKISPTNEIEIGLPLMVNGWLEDDLDQTVKHHAFSAGVAGGLTASVWNRKTTSGRVGIHYTVAIPVETGPFTGGYGEHVKELPSEDIGFGHLSLDFTLILNTP